MLIFTIMMMVHDDGTILYHCLVLPSPEGHGKTPKDAASVRATHPIPAACGVYYFEVKIISKGRDG